MQVIRCSGLLGTSCTGIRPVKTHRLLLLSGWAARYHMLWNTGLAAGCSPQTPRGRAAALCLVGWHLGPSPSSLHCEQSEAASPMALPQRAWGARPALGAAAGGAWGGAVRCVLSPAPSGTPPHMEQVIQDPGLADRLAPVGSSPQGWGGCTWRWGGVWEVRRGHWGGSVLAWPQHYHTAKKKGWLLTNLVVAYVLMTVSQVSAITS